MRSIAAVAVAAQARPGRGGVADVAASLIFAANGFPGAVVPIFNELGGVILRPQQHTVLCGKGQDGRGSRCNGAWCAPPLPLDWRGNPHRVHGAATATICGGHRTWAVI